MNSLESYLRFQCKLGAGITMPSEWPQLTQITQLPWIPCSRGGFPGHEAVRDLGPHPYEQGSAS